MEHIPHLAKDKKLAKILAAPYEALDKKNNLPLVLMSSIMSQQLSTKVAKVIHQRFLDLYPRKKPALQKILDTPVAQLRSIGLSNAKASYVHNVAKFFVEQKLTDKKLHSMDNEDIITLLTQIKGVGRWTVEMLLMFALGREDVFAVDDLGIQQAMIKLYKLDITDKKAAREKMLGISVKWSPYRTYACLYLWKWKDKK